MKGLDQKSIDKLVSGYHEKKGKSFEDRVKAFEKFYTDPEEKAGLQFAQHGRNIALGTGANNGAYHAAYKVLDESVEKLTEKIDDEEKLMKILEAYVDRSLEQIDGEYKGQIEKLKKEGNFKDKDLRKMKGSMFGVFHPDEKGPYNILDENFMRSLKGKTKLEISAILSQIAERSAKLYSGYLHHKATESLIKPEDHFKFAPYVQKKFEAGGLTHEKHPLTRMPHENIQAYTAYLLGGDMSEHGFRQKYEKPKKDAA